VNRAGFTRKAPTLTCAGCRNTSKTANKYAPDTREGANPMVLSSEAENQSHRAAFLSLQAKIGCGPQTRNLWGTKAEIESGRRGGLAIETAEKMTATLGQSVADSIEGRIMTSTFQVIYLSQMSSIDVKATDGFNEGAGNIPGTCESSNQPLYDRGLTFSSVDTSTGSSASSGKNQDFQDANDRFAIYAGAPRLFDGSPGMMPSSPSPMARRRRNTFQFFRIPTVSATSAHRSTAHRQASRPFRQSRSCPSICKQSP
jgi:hypothetical protein